MSSNTKYNVTVNGEVVETKSKKSTAVEHANALFAEDKTREIKVVTESGTEVHTLSPKTSGAKPWTRTETYDGLEIEVPAGYTVAYKRTRVGAVVARADDKSGWLVLQVDAEPIEAANTVEARQITNDLAAAYKTRKAEEAEQAAKAKADAKAKRDAERAAAKAEKEAEKEAKRQKREADKAAKLAEKEAEAAAAAEESELVEA